MTSLTDVSGVRAVPWEAIEEGAASQVYASDLTHPLYHYPARMSPQLARVLILGLTEPGDTVFDPFCGGGTTAVEALYHGRRTISCDLNSLACFVTRAKAWPVGTASLSIYKDWLHNATLHHFNNLSPPVPLVTRDSSRYAPSTHGLLLCLRNAAIALQDSGARRLALLTVLRVGQLMFDCRGTRPAPTLLRKCFESVGQAVHNRVTSYASMCRAHSLLGGVRNSLTVLRVNAEDAPSVIARRRPKNNISLLLTSPPYPGVHILYHRWQVYGRKETSLPYDLIGENDGHFESHYTFGSRARADALYFVRLRSVFSSLRRLLTPSTLVAQLVGFADPERHLESFREAMSSAGYDEVADPSKPDSVIARIVPHRRWYTKISLVHSSAQEYLLIHRLRDNRTAHATKGVAE